MQQISRGSEGLKERGTIGKAGLQPSTVVVQDSLLSSVCSGINQNAVLQVYTGDVPGELHPSAEIHSLLPGEHRIGASKVDCFFGNFHHTLAACELFCSLRIGILDET